MATIEDSNKLTIYEGEETDYAFIPLTFIETSSYSFANKIIQNDGSIYLKKINDKNSDLYNLINEKIVKNSAINSSTISIDTNKNYQIKGQVTNNMLIHNISLYYIENFKYTLDASQYYIGNEEDSSLEQRGNTYMFTITPTELKYEIDDIIVDKDPQLPLYSGE